VSGDTQYIKHTFLPMASFSSVQFSSVAQLCPTLCDPMNCSTPGLNHIPTSKVLFDFIVLRLSYACLYLSLAENFDLESSIPS